MRVEHLPTPPPLEEYGRVVGNETIAELKELADRLEGLRLHEINSTQLGGGVAETLLSYVPFLRMLGIDTQWSILKAEPQFFGVTKTLHNFLQGRNGFSISMTGVYWETLKQNVGLLQEDRDVVTIHDPQPMGLIELVPREARGKLKIIWRCHVHLETLSLKRMAKLGELMRDMVQKYDAAIFSTFQFLPLWSVPCFVIPPFIDPLSAKNRELTPQEVDRTLTEYGINTEKPLITQVSRFDVFKDPLGVIAAFKLVRRKRPCQLLLVGGGASDDPEYQKVLGEVRKTARDSPDIHIIDLPANSHKEINAFQRASSVILQKSVKEGFGLTVAEALWKGKPVIGGKVGGIPLQIRDGWNGFLVSTVKQTAERILFLLKHPKEAEEMGQRGRQFVTQHFLLPRGVKDHLTAIDQLVNGKVVSKNSIISYHPWY